MEPRFENAARCVRNVPRNPWANVCERRMAAFSAFVRYFESDPAFNVAEFVEACSMMNHRRFYCEMRAHVGMDPPRFHDED